MKNLTLLALFIVSLLSFTTDSFSQLSSKERLKYPLALDIPGKVYSNPGPVNTMPNPLEFFNINISQNSAPQNEPSGLLPHGVISGTAVIPLQTAESVTAILQMGD